MSKENEKKFQGILGMFAVEKRFITEQQFKKCLNFIELFEPDKTLEEVLLDKKFLTEKQLHRLKEQLKDLIGDPGGSTTPVISEPEQKTFGENALEKNMIDSSQLDKALEKQDKYLERGLNIQVGQIMYKMGFLTMTQLKRLLKTQLKKVLFCKHCKKNKVVYNYDFNQLYQCEKCGFDLEAKTEESMKAKQRKLEQKVSQKKEEDDDIGDLQVLEL